MPSKHKHRKGDTKSKDQHDTNKKFSCDNEPKHSECDGKWNKTRKERHGKVEWMVRWAPCRKDEAVQFMKKKHGYAYNPNPGNADDPKTEKKYSKKKYPALHYLSGVPRPSHKHNPARVASGKHNTREQAASRPHNEHRQRPPPTPAETDAYVARVREALNGPGGIASSPGLPLNPGMVRSTYTAGNGNMVPAPAPVMPLPRDARPVEKHQKRRNHQSSNKHEPEQEPQLSRTVPPGHHRSHHHKAKPEQEQRPSAAFQPPWTMPAGMASPRGMAVPQRVPSTQGPTDGHYQRHQPVPTIHSSHGLGPQPSATIPPPPEAPPTPAVGPALVAYPPQAPPGGQQAKCRYSKSSRKPEAEVREAPQPRTAMITPPGSMRESMANLTGGDMSVPRPGGSRGYGDVRAAGPSNMPPPPPPMNMTMPARPAAEDISLLPAAQPGPGMPRLPRTHLFPTAPPQAGDTAATAGGAFGPQAMSARSSRRAPPKADMAMPPRPKMEPPPMSMPPFPGTGPGTPVPFDSSMSPAPSAPAPPVPDGALD